MFCWYIDTLEHYMSVFLTNDSFGTLKTYLKDRSTALKAQSLCIGGIEIKD